VHASLRVGAGGGPESRHLVTGVCCQVILGSWILFVKSPCSGQLPGWVVFFFFALQHRNCFSKVDGLKVHSEMFSQIRVTEWWGLEGTSVGHLVHHPR